MSPNLPLHPETICHDWQCVFSGKQHKHSTWPRKAPAGISSPRDEDSSGSKPGWLQVERWLRLSSAAKRLSGEPGALTSQTLQMICMHCQPPLPLLFKTLHQALEQLAAAEAKMSQTARLLKICRLAGVIAVLVVMLHLTWEERPSVICFLLSAGNITSVFYSRRTALRSQLANVQVFAGFTTHWPEMNPPSLGFAMQVFTLYVILFLEEFSCTVIL